MRIDENMMHMVALGERSKMKLWSLRSASRQPRADLQDLVFADLPTSTRPSFLLQSNKQLLSRWLMLANRHISSQEEKVRTTDVSSAIPTFLTIKQFRWISAVLWKVLRVGRNGRVLYAQKCPVSSQHLAPETPELDLITCVA